MNGLADPGEPLGDAISDADRASDLDAAHRAAIDAIRRDAGAQVEALRFELELERATRRRDELERDRLDRTIRDLRDENSRLKIEVWLAEEKCSDAEARVNGARFETEERDATGSFDDDF
jgi:hypothetical protein